MRLGDITLPMAAAAEADDGLRPGQLFGRYLIVDRVGEGGVGEVYAAYDPSLDRRIALKVLREGVDGESSQGAAGLVREAKALASLSHPNVVTVHEVGQEDDRVYVAMELVEGRDLEHWIAENPDRSWRETLGVFIDAGKGLAAAHARGILHRDFKPANVLIGDDDWVRVSDFGLATLLSTDDRGAMSHGQDIPDSSMDVSMTLGGGMVGTPYYMAPEQLDGQATVRSDVYAFCLALLDALSGTRAFETTSFLELATLKSTRIPTEPDATRGVPAVVRRAIERGLHPQPQERWPSMDPLLEQLQQALEPPARSALPWVLGLGALAVGAAFLAQGSDSACTGAAAALRPTWNSGRRAAVVQGIADSESPIAAETVALLAPKLDAFSSAWSNTHNKICEATQRGEQSATLLDHRMTCLRRQRLEFGAALEILEHADGQVVQRAIRVADSLPEPEKCESQQADPDVLEASSELEDARTELAHIKALLAAGKYDEAQTRAESLRKTATELDAPRFEGEALTALGDAQYENGQPEIAVDTLEQAAFQGVVANAPDVVLRASAVLTVVESAAGHPDAGLRWSRLAAATIEATGNLPADRAINLANRATALTKKGDYAAAEASIREALKLEESLTAQQRINLLQTLGGVLYYLARYGEAVEVQEKVVAQLQASVGRQHPNVALAFFNLGTFQTAQGQFSEGDEHLRRALEIQEHALGPLHIDLADTLNSIGASAYQQGRTQDAVVAIQRALDIKRRELDPTHPHVLDATVNLAMLISDAGDVDRGSAMLEEVILRMDELEDPPAATRSSAWFNLGRLRQRQDRLDEAGLLFEAALELDEERLGPDDPRLATLLIGLGVLRKKQARTEEALELYQRGLAIQEGKLEPNHPSLLAVLNNIASTQLVLDNPKEAKESASRLLSLSEGRDDYTARATYLLAQAHLALGERGPALRLGREALQLHRQVPELAEDVEAIEAFVSALR